MEGCGKKAALTIAGPVSTQMLVKCCRDNTIVALRQPLVGLMAEGRREVAISRHSMPELWGGSCPSPKGGRRESRVPTAPAVSCAKCALEAAHEHTGSAETARLSPRNGLTAYFLLSPVSEFWFVTVACGTLPANLAPATGVRTTRLGRTLRRFRPARSTARLTPKRPSRPQPYVS
jgi:hypothetical protein